MDLKQIYTNCGAYLKGHFLLSSGNHSEFYLQSAKVLEDPILAGKLADELAKIISNYKIEFDCVCSPAIGGILVGYELARSTKKRFIFTERVEGKMYLRRGFDVKKGEKFIICEDIITTGGSAIESAKIIENLGGKVVAFSAIVNRGFCEVTNLKNQRKQSAKLPIDKPFFAIENFDFEIYEPKNCPFCKDGGVAIKPGSRGN